MDLSYQSRTNTVFSGLNPERRANNRLIHALTGYSLLEQIPFASERERVKMLVKTKSWSCFRLPMRAEAALARYVGAYGAKPGHDAW